MNTKPTILRLYGHLIVPNDNNMNLLFKSVDVCQNVADYLARIYNGKADCSSAASSVQYNDTVILNVSEACIKQILKDFPFIKKVSQAYTD